MGGVDAVAATAVAIGAPLVRSAAWLAATGLALALAAVVGLERLPLVTPSNPTPPHFEFGPVWGGSVSQSIEFPRGPVDALTIWARSKGERAGLVEAHLLRSTDDRPLRSAVFEAPLADRSQPIRIPFAPIDLPPGAFVLRIVAPPSGTTAVLLGATRHNVYADGSFTDLRGHSPVDIDLAFSATGHVGPLTRLRTQASEAPLHLAVGVVVAVMAGAAAGGIAWSTLDQARFGRLVALAVGCGIAAAAIMGPLLGPVAFL